jgi:hypothetical protein
MPASAGVARVQPCGPGTGSAQCLAAPEAAPGSASPSATARQAAARATGGGTGDRIAADRNRQPVQGAPVPGARLGDDELVESGAMTRRLGISAVMAAALTSAGMAVTVADAAPAPKSYKNCTALNRVYPHGVGRKGARDRTSGKPVTTFKVSNKLYALNARHDRDKDGIACEKR